MFYFVTLTLTFDLLLKKFNLGLNFLTKSLGFDFELVLEKLDLVAAGGGGLLVPLGQTPI